MPPPPVREPLGGGSAVLSAALSLLLSLPAQALTWFPAHCRSVGASAPLASAVAVVPLGEACLAQDCAAGGRAGKGNCLALESRLSS